MINKIFDKEIHPDELPEISPTNQVLYVWIARLMKELEQVRKDLSTLKGSITYHAVVCPACFGFGNRLINLIESDPKEAKCYLCKGEGVIYKLNYGHNLRE